MLLVGGIILEIMVCYLSYGVNGFGFGFVLYYFGMMLE